ncbi:MAG: tetratricopeptide repeat protein [Cyanobacteriota bacterium]|nr:tetratricopeptide repeat protein [Cyanobacteriota bacterium]
MSHRWWRSLPALPLALLLGLASIAPARALVPFVVLPQEAELEAAGLGIAQAASRLLQLGQVEDAARLAALTVRLLPDDPRGWVLLAEAQLRSDQPEAALRALTEAKRLAPANAGIWFAEGSLALRTGKPSEAIGLLQRGLALDGKNAGAWFDLGNARILLNQPAPALAAFERASKLRRDFWEAINNQALVLFEAGKRSEAIQRWRRVLEIRPDAAEPNLALAAGLHASSPKGRLEAIQLAEKALAEEPNYVLDSYQKEQLWGDQLRATTRLLLQLPELKTAVERARANADASDPP